MTMQSKEFIPFELSQDEKTRMLYDAREKAKWDEQSRLRGAEYNKAIEIAKNLLGKLSVEDIAASTGLTPDTVAGLR